MKLSTVSVSHYKSLSKVTVKLHPLVTVLVGPNAVGKSNFVDALRFLRDTAKLDLEHAIAEREGMARIRSLDSKPDTYPELFADFTNAAPDSPLTYYKVLATGSADGYAMSFFPEPIPSYGVEKTVQSWKFSALNVQTLRNRNLYTKDGQNPLKDDGSNWASVVYAASKTKKGKYMLERIFEMMRVVLPAFQSVSVTAVGSNLVPQFKFGSSADSHHAHMFDPIQLSDGTLRIFGILLSLYQSPAPSLIVIEEPEQTVNPGALAVMADAFKEVSEITQVIITTHSPHLVDHFDPKNIRVVTMEDGLTHIGPLKNAQKEAVDQGFMTLGELMAAEGLFPECSE